MHIHARSLLMRLNVKPRQEPRVTYVVHKEHTSYNNLSMLLGAILFLVIVSTRAQVYYSTRYNIQYKSKKYR